MTIDEKIYDYILEHTEDEPGILKELDRRTHVQSLNPRMISGHLEGRILKLTTRLCGAKRVLELGTFTGYSALCFAEGVGEDGEVVTVDRDDENGELAAEYFEKSGMGDRIRQVTGDALERIEEMKRNGEGLFDLVFIDADKREYRAYLEAVYPLVKSGGVIMADNTLWDGHVVEPEHQKDAQTRGVMEFNDSVKGDDRFSDLVILPLRDGLSIMRKR